jgi:hypothetical protein
MPADSYTDLLSLLKQGTGNNNDTWGDLFNDEVVEPLEDAIAGAYSLVTTGGTSTLTTAQARMATLIVSGVLVSNAIIVVPNLTKVWVVLNQTSGAFTVTIKTTSGSAATIASNAIKFAVCNGADVVTVG